MEVDFLLIGQGLAGTVLSWRLIQNGYRVHLIGNPNLQSCSRVAAGLYNPITGRKMVKTWEADTLFPLIEPFYRQLERELGVTCLFPKQIYRPFLTVEEQNEWMGNSCDSAYTLFVEKVKVNSQYPEVNDPYGGVFLSNSGYLDVRVLVDVYADWLKARGLMTTATYQEDDLDLSGQGVRYKDIKARAVIYTNGLGAMESRFFSWLPFRPVRGEVLTVSQDFYPDEVINRGVFRITLPNGLHRVGSTYDNQDITSGATEKGKGELLDKLGNLVSLPVRQLVDHQWGVRPATKDRKPILGKHPAYGQLYIFNGFGAKGVSLTPYFSEEMINLLTLNREPRKEVNINRFFKYI